MFKVANCNLKDLIFLTKKAKKLLTSWLMLIYVFSCILLFREFIATYCLLIF